MAAQVLLTQRLFQIILASLSLYAAHSHASPLSDTNSSSCPKGWYRYDRFCLTRGQGTSEKAVALYCDGFGGIGIKGICIIKVPIFSQTNSHQAGDSESNSSDSDLKTLDSGQGTDASSVPSSSSSDTEKLLSLYRSAITGSEPSSDLFGAEIPGTGMSADESCPGGWSHYRHMCVYKPSSLTETCHLLGAVEFHGICVKHANFQDITDIELEEAKSREKRICCCASFKAKGNNYGC